MHTGLFALLSMEDAPPIEAFYHQYTHIYLGQALVGCLLVFALAIIFRPLWRESPKGTLPHRRSRGSRGSKPSGPANTPTLTGS